MNICKLIGHKVEYPLADDSRATYCPRCKDFRHEGNGEEPLNHFVWKRVYWWLRQPLKRWKERLFGWCKPCGDCGKRFGRHDETQDHCPF